MSQSSFNYPAAAILMMVFVSGCASTTTLIRDPAVLVHDPGSLFGHPRIEKNVARVVALWEPATGKGVDDKNARGFAGQILFFGSGCETGARVHGTVNIYEYDNYRADSVDDPELLHTFTFDPDAWEVHRGQGTFGHSYSVFIPYMNKRKEQVHCGMKVEIVLDDGRRISTGETEVMLPGQAGNSPTTGPTRGFVRQNRIGPKSVESAAFTTKAPDPKMDTFSIPLPKR